MRQRGFTLIELLVVIAVMAVIMGAFLAAFGVFSAGDPLKDGANEVKNLVEKGRSKALARSSRFEMLVDFERAEIHSWERRTITFFGFESDMGSDEFFLNGALYPKPNNYEENLLAGSALAVWSGSPTYSIANDDEFSSSADNDGLVVSFDFLSKMSDGEAAPVIAQNDWSVQVDFVRDSVAYFSATIRGIPHRSRVPVAYDEWAKIEIVLARQSPRFYVNGVPADLRFGSRGASNDQLGQLEEIDAATSTALINTGDIRIGSRTTRPFLMDNLKIEKLAPVQVLELADKYGVYPMPPSADVSQTLNEELWPTKAKASVGRILPIDGFTASGLKRSGPPRKAMIFFDERGQLDTTMHRGAVNLVLVSRAKDPSFGRKIVLEISALGAIRERDDRRQEAVAAKEKKPSKTEKDYGTKVQVKKKKKLPTGDEK